MNMNGNSGFLSFILLGRNRRDAGDEQSLMFEVPLNDPQEVAPLEDPGGDAPLYPEWIYQNVVLPRLLWEEAEARREADARRQQALSSTGLPPLDYESECNFTTGYDFEWWLDSSSNQSDSFDDAESQVSSKTVKCDDKNFKEVKKESVLLSKTMKHSKNWTERFMEVKRRREKIEQEKLSRIVSKINEKNKRLNSLNK